MLTTMYDYMLLVQYRYMLSLSKYEGLDCYCYSQFDLYSKPGFYKIMHEAYVPFGTCMKSLHASVHFLPAHIVTPS